MAGAFNLNPTFCLKVKTLKFIPFRVTTALRTQFVAKPNPVAVKCCPDDGEGTGKSKEGLSITELVGTGVDELLSRVENRELLKNLNDATERVDRAKKELVEIQRQEDEVRQMRQYVQKMETYTTEIAECQSDVLKARAMIKEAELLLSTDGSSSSTRSTTEDDETTFDKEKERWESVKAGSISAVVGSLASLPITLAQATAISPLLLLPLATNFVSCALFGVTFRYAVRRDLDDSHLKTGAALAFGLVKGLARLGSLELNTDSLWSRDIIDGALLVSQDVIMFLLAAVGIDLCLKLDLLSPFPSSRGKPPR